MTEENILVLGIGNLLWADEGFGVRAVQELHRRWSFPPQVSLVDGGTQGLKLLRHIQDAQRMIVFDAIDCGLPPGNIRLLENEEVPRFLGAKKLSLHQTGFQEILAVAQLTGKQPDQLVLIGVQPANIEDYGGGLSPQVREQMPAALSIARSFLRRWGCRSQRCGARAGSDELLMSPFLGRGEAGADRPAITSGMF